MIYDQPYLKCKSAAQVIMKCCLTSREFHVESHRNSQMCLQFCEFIAFTTHSVESFNLKWKISF